MLVHTFRRLVPTAGIAGVCEREEWQSKGEHEKWIIRLGHRPKTATSGRVWSIFISKEQVCLLSDGDDPTFRTFRNRGERHQSCLSLLLQLTPLIALLAMVRFSISSVRNKVACFPPIHPAGEQCTSLVVIRHVISTLLMLH